MLCYSGNASLSQLKLSRSAALCFTQSTAGGGWWRMEQNHGGAVPQRTRNQRNSQVRLLCPDYIFYLGDWTHHNSPLSTHFLCRMKPFESLRRASECITKSLWVCQTPAQTHSRGEKHQYIYGDIWQKRSRVTPATHPWWKHKNQGNMTKWTQSDQVNTIRQAWRYTSVTLSAGYGSASVVLPVGRRPSCVWAQEHISDTPSPLLCFHFLFLLCTRYIFLHRHTVSLPLESWKSGFLLALKKSQF